MKVAREALEFRAYQIYEENPDWGRRRVAKALREEYGVALRDSVLNSIRKETANYRQKQEIRDMAEYSAIRLFTTKPGLKLQDARIVLRNEYKTHILSTKYLRDIRANVQMTEAMLLRIREAQSSKVAERIHMHATRLRFANLNQKLPEVSQADYRERARLLDRMGFLRWEWQWLSYHELDTPAMKRMLSDRSHMVDRLISNQNLSQREIEDRIVRLYKQNGWFFNDGRFNPFKMLEAYYRKDTVGQPTDKTPTTKRRGGRSDFVVLREKTNNKEDKFRYGI